MVGFEIVGLALLAHVAKRKDYQVRRPLCDRTGLSAQNKKRAAPGAALVVVSPDFPVECWKLGPDDGAASSHFFGLFEIVIRRPHEQSLRRRINRRSRPRIKIVRCFPKFIDGSSHTPL